VRALTQLLSAQPVVVQVGILGKVSSRWVTLGAADPITGANNTLTVLQTTASINENDCVVLNEQ
jgi:hypothetical protein